MNEHSLHWRKAKNPRKINLTSMKPLVYSILAFVSQKSIRLHRLSKSSPLIKQSIEYLGLHNETKTNIHKESCIINEEI